MQSKYQGGGMSHILDDFFFIGPRDALSCKNGLTHFLYNRLGLQKKCQKLNLPLQKLLYMG